MGSLRNRPALAKTGPWGQAIDSAAVLPDGPRDIVRLIVKIEEHGGIVSVVGSAIAPEGGGILVRHFMLAHRLAPHARVRPMAVDQHVASRIRRNVDQTVGKSPIGRAAVRHSVAVTEPAVLRERQAHNVCMP